MFGILAQKRKITSLIQKEKGEIGSRTKEERLGRAVSTQTGEKTTIYHVSVWTLLPFHGY
jgi:hypothetical protein